MLGPGVRTTPSVIAAKVSKLVMGGVCYLRYDKETRRAVQSLRASRRLSIFSASHARQAQNKPASPTW